MSNQTRSLPETLLQAIVFQAIQAYELAQAACITAERQAQYELQQHLDALQYQQHAQSQQIEADYQREHTLAVAEQERLGSLLAAIEQVRKASSDLLEKAGLAHIAGVSLPLDDFAVPAHHQGEAVAKEFAAAQLAYVDLRTSLLRLATTLATVGQWEEARQIMEPLLTDKQSPLYAKALDLFCEVYYQLASAALEAGNWADAQQGFTKVLSLQTSFKNARELLRRAYLIPAKEALATKRFDEARQLVEGWFQVNRDDAKSRDMLCEIYYSLSKMHMQQQDWKQGSIYLKALHALHPMYRDTANWLVSYPWLAWLGVVEIVREFGGQGESESLVCFSPDGRLLASGSREGVKLWDIATIRLVSTLKGHNGVVWDVAFSPDGNLLASGGADSTVRLWSTTSGQLVSTLTGHSKQISKVIFSLDGRLLASGGADGTVKLWRPKV